MLERNPNYIASELRHDRPASAEEGIGRAEFVDFARRHFLPIAACMALGFVAAGLYVASEEPLFTAQTQILIDLKTPALLDSQSREVETSLDTAEVESQMTVLRSEMIANMVIDELDLTSDPEFQGEKPPRLEVLTSTLAKAGTELGVLDEKTAETWRDDIIEGVREDAPAAAGDAAVDPESGEPVDERRLALALFQSRLGVSRVSVSYVIQITFNSRDPEKAARIANATAEAYVREQLLSKLNAMEQGNAWLEGRLNELRHKLNTATQAAQSFRARHDYSIPETPEEPPAAAEEAAGAADVPSDDPTLEELEATADTYRKLYGSVLESYTSSMQHKSYPYSLVRVITPASPPFDKSHPKTKIVILFGGLAGLLLGVGLAFGRQTLDGTVRSGRQLRTALGVDCIVEVPRPRSSGKDVRGLATVAVDRGSGFAEAIGRLKTAIRVNAKADGSISIGVASSQRGEDKSVTASNLGLVCVASGYRTLVVDGNPLRGTLSKFLPRPADAGETGPAKPDLGPSSPVSRLHWYDLLPRRFGESAIDWARTSGLKSSWKDLQPPYEGVIVDLPAIEDSIDVLPALPALDFIVILAEWGSTPLDAVGRSVRVADAMGVPLLGVVLTKVQRPDWSRWRMRRHPIR